MTIVQHCGMYQIVAHRKIMISCVRLHNRRRTGANLTGVMIRSFIVLLMSLSLLKIARCDYFFKSGSTFTRYTRENVILCRFVFCVLYFCTCMCVVFLPLSVLQVLYCSFVDLCESCV